MSQFVFRVCSQLRKGAWLRQSFTLSTLNLPAGVSQSSLNAVLVIKKLHYFGRIQYTGDNAMFRILAIDGGGIKGVFAAAALDQFEQHLDKPIANYFDLIVGTSTGGIIALGLACNLKAEQLLSLYKNEGAKIFSPSETRRAGLLDWIFQPKYGEETLKAILLEYFSKKLFEEIQHPLCITSFDAASAEPVLLKTRYHESLIPFPDLSVVDVALATSAAPTYFSAAKTPSGVMIDGGVWANCPVMVGIPKHLACSKRRSARLLS